MNNLQLVVEEDRSPGARRETDDEMDVMSLQLVVEGECSPEARRRPANSKRICSVFSQLCGRRKFAGERDCLPFSLLAVGIRSVFHKSERLCVLDSGSV